MTEILNPSLCEQFKDLSEEKLNKQLQKLCTKSCTEEKIEKIKYLLSSAELPIHADINANRNINWACQVGSLEFIKYILLSPELEKKADYNSVSRCSTMHERLDVLKYILTSPDFPDINLQEKMESSFMGGVFLHKTKVIEFLIFEMNIKKSPTIEKILINNVYIDKAVEKMFEKRELHQNLESNLPSNMETQRKIKL